MVNNDPENEEDEDEEIVTFNEVFTFPGLFHMESMESMESLLAEASANLLFHGHHGIQLYSTWIPLDSIWNLGISTLDSMEQVHMDSAEIPYGKYHDICCQK